jgi:phage shock protein PspC (stress-responsive transcriptional regulator)
MNRRLYRCRHDKLLAGVAAGVAEYFDLDPSLVRILFLLSIFLGGVGLFLYIAMAIIVPLEPITADAGAGEATVVVPEGHRHAPRADGPWTTIIGLGLILFGGLALVQQVLPGLDVEQWLVPALAVGIGAFLVARSVRREPMET